MSSGLVKSLTIAVSFMAGLAAIIGGFVSAAFAGGVNAKTPALLIESKITDSQSNKLLGEGLVTVQGESFRTDSGSVDSFIAMAKKAVQVAMETSANPTPTDK
jgi:hypothetical protein